MPDIDDVLADAQREIKSIGDNVKSLKDNMEKNLADVRKLAEDAPKAFAAPDLRLPDYPGDGRPYSYDHIDCNRGYHCRPSRPAASIASLEVFKRSISIDGGLDEAGASLLDEFDLEIHPVKHFPDFD